LVLLATRKNYRLFPVFSSYVLVNFTTGVLAFFVYHHWGFSSLYSWRIAWGMQGAVITARLWPSPKCADIFSNATRDLGRWLGDSTALYGSDVCIFDCGSNACLGTCTARGRTALEVSIVTVVVGVLLLTRYYDVQVNATDSLIAGGLVAWAAAGTLRRG